MAQCKVASRLRALVEGGTDSRAKNVQTEEAKQVCQDQCEENIASTADPCLPLRAADNFIHALEQGRSSGQLYAMPIPDASNDPPALDWRSSVTPRAFEQPDNLPKP